MVSPLGCADKYPMGFLISKQEPTNPGYFAYKYKYFPRVIRSLDSSSTGDHHHLVIISRWQTHLHVSATRHVCLTLDFLVSVRASSSPPRQYPQVRRWLRLIIIMRLRYGVDFGGGTWRIKVEDDDDEGKEASLWGLSAYSCANFPFFLETADTECWLAWRRCWAVLSSQLEWYVIPPKRR